MGFLAPWFLLGLAGLAAPLYLHLLRRQTTNPREFSSLMFFEPRTQASMRHRRLRYLWLLALRLALLALLVLAFADPFLYRPVAQVSGDRLTVFALDDSFSMQAADGAQSRLAAAQHEALAALAGLRGSGQVMALGSRLEILTQPTADPAALRAAILGIQPGWSHADFGELARGLRALTAAAPVPTTVELFSDMQQSSMPANFDDLRLPANVTLVTHGIGALAPNWTVTSVHAPSELWGSPKDTTPAQVEAVVAGYNTPAARFPVSLLVNGATVATQTVALPASGAATVVFPQVAFPFGWSECTVQIVPPASDGFTQDNRAVFAVRRSDPERILFVHAASDARSPLYFGAALGSGPDAAFALDPVSEAGVLGHHPSQDALVVLSDVGSLPAGFAAELAQYVNSGGGLLIAAGPDTRTLPVFGASASPQDYGEQYLAVGSSDASYPPTALLGNWPGVRFYFAAGVSPGSARVVARLADQTPLLMEKRVGEGRVLLFASGFDGLTNDFPLHPAFVAFVRQAAAYLAGDEDTSPHQVDDYLALRTAKEQGQAGGLAVQVTDPRGHDPLTLRQASTAQTLQLTEAGFYRLTLADGRTQIAAVNPDRRESDLLPMPEETLALWRGAPANTSPAAPGASPAVADRVPVDAWWYVMLLMLLAAVAESAAAARYLSVSRDEEKPVDSPLHPITR